MSGRNPFSGLLVTAVGGLGGAWLFHALTGEGSIALSILVGVVAVLAGAWCLHVVVSVTGRVRAARDPRDGEPRA